MKKIEHDRQIAVALADVDLIDGDLAEVVQFGLAKFALEVVGLDFLDGVPADLQMVGDVLDSHESGEFQGISLKGSGVMLLGIGEPDLGLSHRVAAEATKAWHLENNIGRLPTDGEGSENAFDPSLNPDLRGCTLRAPQAFAKLIDDEEGLVLREMLAAKVVTINAETVIE